MGSSEIIGALAEALEVPEEDLTPDMALADVDTYDSAGVLAVIAAIDKKFDASVNPDELMVCQTVQDIVELVERTIG